MLAEEVPEEEDAGEEHKMRAERSWCLSFGPSKEKGRSKRASFQA